MGRPTTNDETVAARLADVAFETLAAQGASSVTVRGVAAAARSSATAIYNLFGGKDELLAAALTRAARDLFEALTAALAQHETSANDGLQRLEILGGAYLRWGRSHPRLYTALFSGDVSFTPSADADRLGDQDPARLLMEAIGQARAAGQIQGDPQIVATTLWAGLHGLATLIATGAIDPDSGRAAESHLIRTLIHGWTA